MGRLPWLSLSFGVLLAALFYLLPRPSGPLMLVAGPFWHVSAGHLWCNLPFLVLLGALYEIQVGHHDFCVFFLFASVWVACAVSCCGRTLIGASGTMFALAAVSLATSLRRKNFGSAFILAVWLAISVLPLNLAHLFGLILGLAWGTLADRCASALESLIAPA
ncbi:MAG: rhomboid family intramembrane serine protease [Candidatus Eisenbacteria sp.]|nr:rhomboid family intramembrane serine protease [Candidatus Eisenbacteria bacterium]